MNSIKYPFVKELIVDTEGTIRKVVIDFNDYQRLLEAIEDEGLLLAANGLSDPIAEFVEVIQKTPREYWPYLLQTIRLFLDTVNVNPSASNSGKKALDEIQTIDLIQQHEALSKLIETWIDEGDEQEQTETAEYLRKALEEDRISI